MSNYLKESEPGLNHPINTIFYVNTISHAAGKAVLKLTLREAFLDNGGPSCGSIGVIVEYATKIASQGLMDHCFLVEYEVSVISAAFGSKFIVNADIDYSHKPNAIFYCKVNEVKGSSKKLVAVSHGILLGEDSAGSEKTC